MQQQSQSTEAWLVNVDTNLYPKQVIKCFPTGLLSSWKWTKDILYILPQSQALLSWNTDTISHKKNLKNQNYTIIWLLIKILDNTVSLD